MTSSSWNIARPWRGIMVATALPLRDDLSVDYDAYAEHVAWLIENGCDGVVPNGSLGEYQTLTDEERTRVVRTAVEAAGDGARVMPGVAAYGSAEARRWVEQAAEAGCGSVLLLPPNAARSPLRSRSVCWPSSTPRIEPPPRSLARSVCPLIKCHTLRKAPS